MSEYSERVRDLQSRLEGLTGVTQAKCFPTILVATILTPIIVWLVLYFLQPWFVRKKEGSGTTKDNSKVLVWTVIITAVIAAIVFGFSWYMNYDFVGQLCLLK